MVTRKEYINQAIEFTNNKEYIKTLGFPEILEAVAIQFFINPNYPIQFLDFEIETRKRLKQFYG